MIIGDTAAIQEDIDPVLHGLQRALLDDLDLAIGIERQAVGYKEKPRLRSRPDEEKEILRRLADGSEGPPRERQIVKVKRFAIEPMFEEDAVAQMEELGHRFFVFVSAETERVAILYQRDDGDLGMIEPVVGGDYTKGRHPSTTPAKVLALSMFVRSSAPRYART